MFVVLTQRLATERTHIMSDTLTQDAPQSKRAASMPKYGAEKISGDLPDDAPQGRSNLYIGLLAPIATEDNVGEWFQVAYFKTPTGASNAKKAIVSGERPIPAGNWEVEARKVTNPDAPAGTKHSKLYVRYLGEGDVE